MVRILAALATLSLAATPLGAQYALGIGATIPTGSFADASRPGWMLAAGWSPWATPRPALRLWLQGYYGRNTATEEYRSNSGVMMAGVGLSFKPIPAAAPLSPYLIGTVGVLRHGDGTGSTTAPYLGAGAGVSRGRYWLQARYQTTSKRGFVLVAAGTSF